MEDLFSQFAMIVTVLYIYAKPYHLVLYANEQGVKGILDLSSIFTIDGSQHLLTHLCFLDKLTGKWTTCHTLLKVIVQIS